MENCRSLSARFPHHCTLRWTPQAISTILLFLNWMPRYVKNVFHVLICTDYIWHCCSRKKQKRKNHIYHMLLSEMSDWVAWAWSKFRNVLMSWSICSKSFNVMHACMQVKFHLITVKRRGKNFLGFRSLHTNRDYIVQIFTTCFSKTLF